MGYLIFVIVWLNAAWREYYCLWPGLSHLGYRMAVLRMARILLPLAWAISPFLSSGCTPHGASIIAFGLGYLIFVILWLYKNYLCLDASDDIEKKYNTVRRCLKNDFEKVFALKNFEQSWNEIADLLKVDREPRLNTNRSTEDYKKYISKQDLDHEFISWHITHNSYDYKLYNEFCA